MPIVLKNVRLSFTRIGPTLQEMAEQERRFAEKFIARVNVTMKETN